MELVTFAKIEYYSYPLCMAPRYNFPVSLGPTLAVLELAFPGIEYIHSYTPLSQVSFPFA